MKAKYKYYSRNEKIFAEHREIIKKHLNRELGKNEVVHHINGNGFDNRIENMQVMTNSQHSKFHTSQRGIKINCTCPACNKHFVLSQYAYKKRIKRSKSGKIFCSGKCAPPPPPFKKTLNIDGLIMHELKNGLTGYAIAKKHNFCKKTIYNHMKRLKL